MVQRIQERYEIEEQIGAGGMGTVFRATDKNTSTKVALKKLNTEVAASDPDSLLRFEREAEALRELNHPNIVKVFETIKQDNDHYIVMEYVTGGALNTRLKAGQLTIEETLKIAIELADALTRAHYLKIVHRDIKPANVLIADDGTPRLTDFGVAFISNKERITQIDAAIGTPDYMAPEIINADAIDARADIWSFGVMLFEMLTRRHPFKGDNLGQLVTNILMQPPPDLEALRPDAPIALVDLIYRMLIKDPNQRIPSIRLVGAELEVIMQGNGNTSSVHAARLPDADNRFATPTPTPGKPRHNLPAQTTPFIGREEELSQIEQLIRDPNIRLITILGPGGMGKTRLALEAAESHLERFFNGVYFVALAPLSESESILTAIAESVGYTFEQDQRGEQQQLIDFLNGKELLLIVDNFEHVINGAPIISDILRGAPDVQIIATSRERLRLSGETLFTLSGMDFPDWETPEDALEYSAVKLFMQSIQRVRPGYELSADDLTYVARICRMVEGMPLGILLAAAWIEMLSLEEIADEMAQSLDILESDLRDLPERHQSIRAVFDYSWNLLSPDEQQVFVKLSIFRGGFEREAAQKIAGASLKNLTTLVNKSLLIREPSGRYWVHKLLQQYAEEQFEALIADRAEIYKRHAEYYGNLMERLSSALNTRKEKPALAVMDAEQDNLHIAWKWAVDNAYWEALDKVLHPVTLYHIARSRLNEGIQFFHDLAEAILENCYEENERLYWRARSRELWLVGRQAKFDAIHTYASDAYAYFDAQNDPLEMSYLLNNMSYAAMFTGDYENAIAHAREGEEQANKLNDTIMAYISRSNLGYAGYLAGNYETAHEIYTELVKQSETMDITPVSRAFSMNNLGEIKQAMGEFEDAKALYEQALDIFRGYHNRRGIAFTLNNLGGICFMMGMYDIAKEKYQEAHTNYQEIGDLSGIGHSLSAMGNTATQEGNLTSALSHYTDSLELRKRIGDKRSIADSLNDLSQTAFAMQDYDASVHYAEQSLVLRQELGDHQGEAMALMRKGTSLWFTGAHQDAHDIIEHALVMAEDLNNSFLLAQGLSIMGEIYYQQQDYDRAYTHYIRAVNADTIHKMMGFQRFALIGLASVLEQRGEYEHALELVAMTKHKDNASFIKYIDDKANALQDRLCHELGEVVAREAMARGTSKSFEQAIAELRNGSVAS